MYPACGGAFVFPVERPSGVALLRVTPPLYLGCTRAAQLVPKPAVELPLPVCARLWWVPPGGDLTSFDRSALLLILRDI